uniref:Uncharacterized protein n=1 Tax=virus sp. ct9pU4 TaxID=2828248 RepID=A0A8S5RBN7_9VIRU|nr:MAG TPA: hypothetical protein [virus sp. ct9pU4]
MLGLCVEVLSSLQSKITPIPFPVGFRVLFRQSINLLVLLCVGLSDKLICGSFLFSDFFVEVINRDVAGIQLVVQFSNLFCVVSTDLRNFVCVAHVNAGTLTNVRTHIYTIHQTRSEFFLALL